MAEPVTLYSRIDHHLQMGNINTFIQEILSNYPNLRFSMSDLIPAIVDSVEHHYPLLSQDTRTALQSLAVNQSDIRQLVSSLPEMVHPIGKVAKMTLSMTTTIGLVRDIVVESVSTGWAMSYEKTSQLDRVGAAVFQVLRKQLKHPFFWNPKQYRFDIYRFDEIEDKKKTGSSLELSLGICLYSHLIRMPIPADISATGAVSRKGEVMPVDGLDLKLAALHMERHYISRVLVSDRQSHPQSLPPGITICPVKNLEQALETVFPNPVPMAAVEAQLDLTAELKKIESLYKEYYLDSCIQYATDVIGYLDDKIRKKTIPAQQRIPALFECLWRKGSCWCHKGDIKRAFQDLNKAIQLGRPTDGKPQYVEYAKYLNCRINFAVTLKDVFRYPEAEAEHRYIKKEMEKGYATDAEYAKNLSAWSQLCLAQGKYLDAKALQEQAVQKIKPQELYRNLGYLAQINFRSGRLDLAKKQLDKARIQLNELDRESREKGMPFFQWFDAEFCYRKLVSLPRGVRRLPLEKSLKEIIDLYPKVDNYPHALMYKFAGFASLAQGYESAGLALLAQSVEFLEKQRPQSMFHLLAVTVRLGRIQYFISQHQLNNTRTDIQVVRNFFRSRKDIGHFFKPEVQILNSCLRNRHFIPDHLPVMQKAVADISEKIPY